MQRDLPIPDGRTFALGFSFGGAMTFRLSCEASDAFDGFGVVGMAYHSEGSAGPMGVLGGSGSRWLGPCEADNSRTRRPFIQFSGTEDIFYNIDQMRSGWHRYSQRVLRCSGGDNEVFRSGGVFCTRYSQCDRVSAPAASEHCTYEGMGHSWPGEDKSGAQGRHHPATDAAWEFWTVRFPPPLPPPSPNPSPPLLGTCLALTAEYAVITTSGAGQVAGTITSVQPGGR